MDNKFKAQQRADQIQSFNDEIKCLNDDDIFMLDDNQRTSISRYHASILESLTNQYDIDTNIKQKQLSTGMKAASFVGALALAASIFFLFYQFWGYLTTPVQVFILIAAPLLTLLLSHLISQRESTGYFTKLIAMVGFACFVLNLVMLGQIFNITPSDKALLAWAVYGFLLAYAFDIRLLLAIAIFSLAAFIAARVGSWSGMYWIHTGERPENLLLPALIIFSVPMWFNQKNFSGFSPIYRVLGSILFLIPVLILSNWGRGSYLNFDHDFIEGFYQLVGFATSAGLIALGIKRQWSDVVNTGNVFFVLFLYTKLFDWWWEIMPKYLFFLVIALSSVLLLFIYKRLREQSQSTGQVVGESHE
ncbi:MAG: DUF2157 domain-containing protein [Woeseiaceae bacterium]